jgi:aryl-alcohol dehydrogenase-like predicted oxidoreductase
MANSDQLLQRNKDFETTCAHEEASIIARHQVYVGTERARELGYARSIGVSTFSAAELDTVAAAATMPPAVNQVNFNPFAFRRTPRRCCCAGACSAVSGILPSQPTGTGSPRTAGSSTSSSPARNSRNSMPSTAPAAPETFLIAHGGEAPGL